MKNRCKMRKKQHLFFFWIGMMELLLSLRKIVLNTALRQAQGPVREC